MQKIAAAAAHDLNCELTVILNATQRALATLEPGHPAIWLLLMAHAAAVESIAVSKGLLRRAANRGAKASPATLESMSE